jgi:hypothetical protein
MRPEWDGTTEGERQRHEYWREKWAMFKPPDGVHRTPVFHAGLPTIILSGLVGFPLGQALAVRTTGEPGFGGFIGIFVMLLVFGCVNQQWRLGRLWDPSVTRARPSTPRSTARTIVTFTAAGAIVMACLGVWFALSEGDIDPSVAGLRFGAVGAVPGLVIGLLVAWRRRG